MHRLRTIFAYHGGGLADVQWSVQHTWATRTRDEENSLDDALVFLCRYGRFTPEWVERQEESRVMSLLEKVGAWIARENGKREEQPTAPDTADDFG